MPVDARYGRLKQAQRATPRCPEDASHRPGNGL
jgi:hypothetical protein